MSILQRTKRRFLFICLITSVLLMTVSWHLLRQSYEPNVIKSTKPKIISDEITPSRSSFYITKSNDFNIDRETNSNQLSYNLLQFYKNVNMSRVKMTPNSVKATATNLSLQKLPDLNHPIDAHSLKDLLSQVTHLLKNSQHSFSQEEEKYLRKIKLQLNILPLNSKVNNSSQVTSGGHPDSKTWQKYNNLKNNIKQTLDDTHNTINNPSTLLKTQVQSGLMLDVDSHSLSEHQRHNTEAFNLPVAQSNNENLPIIHSTIVNRRKIPGNNVIMQGNNLNLPNKNVYIIDQSKDNHYGNVRKEKLKTENLPVYNNDATHVNKNSYIDNVAILSNNARLPNKQSKHDNLPLMSNNANLPMVHSKNANLPVTRSNNNNNVRHLSDISFHDLQNTWNDMKKENKNLREIQRINPVNLVIPTEVDNDVYQDFDMIEGKGTYRPDFCSACLSYDFPLLINQPELCKSKGRIRLLMFISSAPGNREARVVIRKTWAAKCREPNSEIKCVFVIGRPKDKYENVYIERENKTYGDILQIDFKDSYGNLTYKTISALRWGAKHCAKAKYVMKTDDDMYVNTELIPKMLLAAPRTKFVCGYCWGSSNPNRDLSSKWFVSFKMYRKQKFPPMCSGTGYVMSMDVVRKILVASHNVPFFHLEDVYVSLCLQKFGIMPDNILGFSNMYTEFDACTYRNTVMTSHQFPTKMLEDFWSVIQECPPSNVSPNNLYIVVPYPYIE